MPISPKEGIEIPKGNLKPKAMLPVPRPPATKYSAFQKPAPSPRPIRTEPKSAEASLFIKLEKYKNIVDNLNKLRGYAGEMRNKLDSLEDLRRQLQATMEDTEKVLSVFNSIITDLEKLLYRTGVERPEMPGYELEGYIKDLHSQVEKIKSDLKTI